MIATLLVGAAVIAGLHLCESRFGNVPARDLPYALLELWRSRSPR